MSNTIQGIRGMHDALPENASGWQRLEQVLQGILNRYGYRQIRLPIVERTEVFERSLGASTDIVSKEMYTFTDRNGDSLTLRPEGTAGCVRALIEHGLLQGATQRLWYAGPMFRHEKPQKGRLRQFHQFGAEAFGLTGPDIDAELIAMCARLWTELGIADLRLELNTLGTAAARKHYRDALVAYFSDHRKSLDPESRERLERNPMRILDSKDPGMKKLIDAAPSMDGFLDAGSAAHFAELSRLLEAIGIDYQINPRLVRGLDYYNGTVFEWVSDRLGAQGAVCAGGRYDGLVECFGGDAIPAVGFAMGVERVLELYASSASRPGTDSPHAYLVVAGASAQAHALHLAEKLRDQLPSLNLLTHCGGGSFKSQFKKADKSGAAIALVVGEEELRNGTVGLKPLRGDAEQSSVPASQLAAELKRRLGL